MNSFIRRMGQHKLIILLGVACSSSIYCSAETKQRGDKPPHIVNIVNFIRLLEPRDSSITRQVLYETVVSQIRIMREHHLGGTFLLQYDALMDKRYQDLLKALPRDSFEIGAWWEIPQPLVENAGLKWRGRYPWDWYANIGFTTGYLPAERDKLADVYMNDFNKIFGYYPKSVGCWFIDAHTLNYLYEKYGIEASCNCKDQFGTDGYTLWGGYWGQAYYPSKTNSYMPAQHEEAQIPVPVFRMLGSDPIRQYDDEKGKNRQGVITLEPVYPGAGGNAAWVDWYLREFTSQPSMAFAYTQAGQENSFTWAAMKKGFEVQMPLLEKLRDEHQISIETLSQSGRWFKQQFRLTPPTSVCVNQDLAGSKLKTVWFDSRFFRANLLWEDSSLRFRDIHIFDEKFPSQYEKGIATSNECQFFTLPVMDGYTWSAPGKPAGIRFWAILNGKRVLIKGGDPVFNDSLTGKLRITWPIPAFHSFMTIEFEEKQVTLTIGGDKKRNWFLEFYTGEKKNLPFRKIQPDQVRARFQGTDYSFALRKGRFSKPPNGNLLRVNAENNQIIFIFDQGAGNIVAAK